MSFFTLIDAGGNILKSCFTEDPNYPVPEGNRLLPDNPPNPPTYIPGRTKPLRVEPVTSSSTEIQYLIIDDPLWALKLPNEVEI